MDEHVFAPDNPHLSEPTMDPQSALLGFAINCTNSLPERVATFVQESLSLNTRRVSLRSRPFRDMGRRYSREAGDSRFIFG